MRRPLLTPLLLLLAALAQAQTPAFTTTESMQKEAKASVILLERLHISKREMASIDMAEVVRTYCENLDGAKMYFTEPEVEEFVNRYAKTLDLYLQRGNLTPGFEIYASFKHKVQVRTEASLMALDQPIDLTRDEVFPLERRKAKWPATAAEAS
jgi:carboxyl-terminal processing protease